MLIILNNLTAMEELWALHILKRISRERKKHAKNMNVEAIRVFFSSSRVVLRLFSTFCRFFDARQRSARTWEQSRTCIDFTLACFSVAREPRTWTVEYCVPRSVNMSVTWTNELELKFLEYFQAEPVLWNTNLKDYKTHDAWCRLSELMGVPIDVLKNNKNFVICKLQRVQK